MAKSKTDIGKRWDFKWQRVRPTVSKGGTKNKQWQRLRLLQRVEMVGKGGKWSQMVGNGWEWLEMTGNGWKWLKSE